MDTKSLVSIVEQLEENIEDLEDHIEPLFADAIATTSSKLPLLERAKLNVLLVYSIESLLFSYLRLHGVQAKEHPVFTELTRVKQYFAKIDKVKPSEPGQPKAPPSFTLSKEATGRFIKHALAGNDKFDLERAEREARERFLANRKLKDLESSLREKAAAKSKEEEHKETVANDALKQAALLASITRPEPESESSDGSSSSVSESEDEGEVKIPDDPTPACALVDTNPSPAPAPAPAQTNASNKSTKAQKHPQQPQQGQKRKGKQQNQGPLSKKQRRGKNLKNKSKKKKAAAAAPATAG
ncbi:uncharacterized protein Z518_07895 [Rhinocladiella mackenziei CBS 650.93]|uniref:Exosome complex protein n=1 Tax=Rhinocladiella mackenziei CBS 650.93 TaxID=1442369 RepID=A0A0D2IFA6_9EURO|nr:uncharacterized protein Z518_07895 [Rhinocladiella mackenziei CBS 650.93]KIX01956.1 hypothetical protein Z518_07895 [Rhinocladiella mackenziei CBS 650.93]